MSITASTVQGYCESAITSIGSGDYAGALTSLMQAKAALVALPDSEHAQSRLEWDREAIDALMAECHRAQGAALRAAHGGVGLQTTKLSWAEPTS